MAAIVATGLRKSYGDVQAVRDIGFELAEGEVLALLGPNWCWKDHHRRDSGGIPEPRRRAC